MSRTDDAARDRLRETVAQIVDAMNSLLAQMRSHLTAGDVTSDSVGPDALDYDAFESFVREALDGMESPILGMGYLPDLSATPDATIRWWYRRTPTEGVRWRPLPANTHPMAIDFYDPQSTSWWQDAAQAATPTSSGPFVDVSGTNAYVVTFAEALRHNGRVHGVLAIDIPVSALQDICQNDLLDLPRPSSVVSHTGTVIATNSGSLLGNSVDLDTLDEDVACRIAGTSWLLV